MKIGAQAELAAAGYLSKRGLHLITQNYHCRFGEIDLILQDGETLVFAEVRLRNSNVFGGAAASIDAKKQHKLVCTAQYYLSELKHIPPCRFDVVLLKSLRQPKKSTDPELIIKFHEADIVWIKNAFGA